MKKPLKEIPSVNTDDINPKEKKNHKKSKKKDEIEIDEIVKKKFPDDLPKDAKKNRKL